MYLCMYLCMYLSMYVYVFQYVFLYTCMYLLLYVCITFCMYVCMFASMYECMYVAFIYIYVAHGQDNYAILSMREALPFGKGCYEWVGLSKEWVEMNDDYWSDCKCLLLRRIFHSVSRDEIRSTFPNLSICLSIFVLAAAHPSSHFLS